MNFLIDNDGIYISDLIALADVSSSIINILAKNGYIEFREEKIERNPFQNKRIEKDKKKVLNKEQKECFDKIAESIDKEEYSNNLIFGITGSRKNGNLFTIN